jgi:oligo-1,6-glucosidase
MLILMQRGTAFLYQGDEIGMTNFPFTAFSQFDDVEIKGNYKQVLASGVSSEKYLTELNKSGRDHARTPMQWSDENQAGFTTGNKSWLPINPNYSNINVKGELNFYRQLLAIRKGNEDLIYGDYKDLAPDNKNVFAFTRTGKNNEYLIVLNMSGQKTHFEIDSKFKDYKLIISNQKVENKNIHSTKLDLEPWEALLFKRN